jgi:hypothetical protein
MHLIDVLYMRTPLIGDKIMAQTLSPFLYHTHTYTQYTPTHPSEAIEEIKTQLH